MKIKTAIKLAGSQDALAVIFQGAAKAKRDPSFSVTRQAVGLWAKAGEMPPLRVYQLRDIKPEWFAK
jgi:hypothetical protein